MNATNKQSQKTRYEAHLVTSIGGIIEFHFCAAEDLSEGDALEVAIRKSGLDFEEIIDGSWARAE